MQFFAAIIAVLPVLAAAGPTARSPTYFNDYQSRAVNVADGNVNINLCGTIARKSTVL